MSMSDEAQTTTNDTETAWCIKYHQIIQWFKVIQSDSKPHLNRSKAAYRTGMTHPIWEKRNDVAEFTQLGTHLMHFNFPAIQHTLALFSKLSEELQFPTYDIKPWFQSTATSLPTCLSNIDAEVSVLSQVHTEFHSITSIDFEWFWTERKTSKNRITMASERYHNGKRPHCGHEERTTSHHVAPCACLPELGLCSWRKIKAMKKWKKKKRRKRKLKHDLSHSFSLFKFK